MAPRKSATSDNTVERRRSTRIAEKPKSPTGDVPAPKPRAKRGSTSKKREAGNDDAGEASENRQVKKAKGSGEENGEEQDQLADDDEVESANVLDIGDVLPAVTLRNEKDEDVNVAELARERGLVLFLVPKADTPGCTKQACGFRDSHPDFTKFDYNVYCLSADTVSAQAKWQIKQKLPYSLLSDRKRVLIKALGALEASKTKRSHFIFEKGGKLVDKKIPVKPQDSPQQALEFIQKVSQE